MVTASPIPAEAPEIECEFDLRRGGFTGPAF